MFRLSVVTPEKIVYDDDVASIVAPGSVGYLGILSNHAPIITSLVPGKLTIKDHDGQEITMAVSGGFLENSSNTCTILADAAEFAHQIDIDRAQRARERALERIRNAAGNIDIPRAQASYARAHNRVTIGTHHRAVSQ
jgi:F-type H+-transporting ATPase subunit epsilon